MNRNTRTIAEGAMTAALSVVVLLSSEITGGFMMPFLPLPIIIYGIYHTLKDSILVYVVSILLVAIIPGQLPTTVMMVMYGFVALVYVGIDKKNVPNSVRFLVVLLGTAINYIVMIAFFGPFFGLDFNITLTEVRTFLRINNENLVKTIAIGVIFITMVLETIVIFMSANMVRIRLAHHRNKP